MQVWVLAIMRRRNWRKLYASTPLCSPNKRFSGNNVPGPPGLLRGTTILSFFIYGLWQEENEIESIMFSMSRATRLKKLEISPMLYHYAQFWNSNWGWGPIQDDLPGPRLDDSHRAFLDAPLSDTEIWDAIKCLPLGKAPGIDGFGSSFYRSYWNIIKGKVTAVISCFFSTGRMPPSCKKTLVTLIPKKEMPETVMDFRPISLCTTKWAQKFLQIESSECCRQSSLESKVLKADPLEITFFWLPNCTIRSLMFKFTIRSC